MKLLIVTQALDQNHPILGFFHRWVIEFAEHADQVTVIASSVGDYELPENVSVHSLGKESGASRLTRMWKLVSLCVSLRNKYDVVFVHMIVEFVLVCGLLWKAMGKSIGLWYVHGTVSLRLRIAAFMAHYIFTTSPESCRLKNKKIHCLGHGVVIKGETKKRDKSVPHLITVGRISPSKHLDSILEALQILREKNISFTAEIIGGPATKTDVLYAKDVERKANEINILYRGPLPHDKVLDSLASADIFLSASQTGSVDKAVLEAAAGGIVPVFSNRAFAEALGNTNLKVDGHPESFAGLLEVLLSDKELWEKHAQQVHSAVKEKHSLDQLIPRVISVYEKT